MKKSTIATLSFATGLLLCTAAARAEDIDIFSGASSNGATPNVLILVDSSASNNADFLSPACPYPNISNVKLLDSVQCALATAIDAIRNQPTLVNHLNIGMVIYGTQSNQGGMWVNPSIAPPGAPAQLPFMDTSGINTFLSNIEAGYPYSNSRSGPAVFQEAWAFFTGNRGVSGANYSNHITLSCQRSFIIFIGAAAKQGSPAVGNGNFGLTGLSSYLNNASTPLPTTAEQVQINTAASGPSQIGPNNGDDGAWTDEWARYLFDTDFGSGALDDRQNIVTYTIGATGGNPDAAYVQHLKSMAKQGGGAYFDGGSTLAISNALLQIFNEVAAVSTVFASASLPVNTNIQGTYSNQVFIGMFRTDPSAGPRWIGNLKQYQFGLDTSTTPAGVYLADTRAAPNNHAISSSRTGFFSPNAISFWTSINTNALPDNITTNLFPGFFGNDPKGAGNGYDLPDGEIVDKGGVGQQIRLANLQDDYVANPHSPRNVYTCVGSCTNGSSLSGSQFATDNANLTSAMFGINPPSTAISSISRNGTTVTVVLAAAPSPALTNGQSVTIQGSAYSEINGTFTITLVNSTTFTYTITEDPPSPATGTYTATIPSSPLVISSLVRGGGANPGTTVTVTTASAHGYVNGDSITISGATGTEYNGTFTISNASGTSFQYTIADSPATSGGNGTATVGSSNVSIPAGGISRTASNSSLVSVVLVTVSNNLPSGKFQSGNLVSISGASPAGYNVTNVALIGGNQTGSCGSFGSPSKKQFCFNLTTTPASPDNGATKRADHTASIAITALTHPVACTAGSATATATATTASGPPFVAGDTVSIGGTQGANESAYVGTFSVASVNAASHQFTYSITTTPPCTPSASGVTAITSTGGVDKNALINWVRGDDNVGDERSPGNGITIRPSVHGDVLHSRPTVVAYDSSNVVVFYGANDGTFRAVNGNQSGNIGSVPPGGELWSFIPSEFFTKFARLYLNSPMIKLFNTPTGITPTPQPKDYFLDGSTGVFQGTIGGNQKVYLYLSARRGGRWIYALDVTNKTDPKLLWKIGCPNLADNTGCTGGFSELGQTWSTPRVASIKGNSNPVLIFGGGYDPNNEDSEPPTTDSMGRAIFIVDAVTGAKLWQAGGTGSTASTCTNCSFSTDFAYAFASDVTLLDRDRPTDGFIDRVYAADLGGNVFRVDLEPGGNITPADWKVTKFASVGGASTDTTKRKIMFPPDVVATANFDAVLFGTGDREHPMYGQQARSIVNRFYMIKDTKVGKDATGWTAVVDATSDTTNTAPSSTILFNATSTPYPSTLPANGFYVTMMGVGEKFVNGPTTFGGFVYFGTNTPTAPGGTQSCSNGLGTATGYQINFITGAANTVIFDNGGMPPSPVTGSVDIVGANGSTTTVPFCIGCGGPPSSCSGADCTSIVGGTRPPIPVNPVRKRVFWFLEKHDN